MTTSGTVLVTGATGNIGSGLVPTLLGAGVKVRALVRDEAKAAQLRTQGAEVVVGDLENLDSVKKAVAGVSKIFLLTWNGPTAPKQASNVIQVAKQAGKPHIVRLRGYGSPKSRIIRDHDTIDKELKASGLPYTIVAPTFFMQNSMMAAQTVASDGKIYMPFKDGKVGMPDVRDIVAVAAKVLTTDGHQGKEYVVTGPKSISFHDVASALSKALGKEVQYVNVPPEAGKQAMMGMGMPEWIVDGYMELMEDFADNWGDRVSPDVQNLLGRPGHSVEQFAQDFAKYFQAVPASA
ncbi:MAG: SDR family oxidoreductase [Chloroflexi bacterium]|nr:SDR family oxidoreductase [Chloroflexota bacterium]